MVVLPLAAHGGVFSSIFAFSHPSVLRGDSMYHSLSNAPHSIDVTKINSTTDDDSGLAQIAGVGHMATWLELFRSPWS